MPKIAIKYCMHSQNFLTPKFGDGVPAEKNSSLRKSRNCQLHPRGIPATFRPIPTGNRQIPQDSRRPYPHAHL